MPENPVCPQRVAVSFLDHLLIPIIILCEAGKRDQTLFPAITPSTVGSDAKSWAFARPVGLLAITIAVC